MDLRPRKKQKHQEASNLEAPPSGHLSEQLFPSSSSNKRKYRAPSEVATSPTDSTSAADLNLPVSKRTRFSPEDTPESTNSPRYQFRRRSSPPSLQTKSKRRHNPMPKSRGRDNKKAGGEQSSSSTAKKEKKSSSRSASTSKSSQAKDVTDPGISSSKSKKSRRKDLEFGDPDPEFMEVDQDDEMDSPSEEHDQREPAIMDDDYSGGGSGESVENEPPARLPRLPPGLPPVPSHILRNLHSMRGLQGMMDNVHGTLKSILPNLRNYSDPTMQHIALQELAELLAISTEETLAGYLAPEPYVVELIKILRGGEEVSPFGDNPDTMLLASRCLANLMEALPQSTGTVVYSGAVPVLCSKLLEIQYIDLAEQALSTLEKISVEYPTSIVREGGLTACLMYLDFFSTNVQRTAVTTAANCCRNIPIDSFETVKEIMPNLKAIISGTDQKVVEQGCLCIARIVEGFKNYPDRLEQLISEDILEAVLAILLPGNTSVAGSSTHTQLLRLLGVLVKNSAKLGAQMLKMNLVDTVYQILTGVSPREDTDMESRKKTSIFVLQALIHRPHNQILETLQIVWDLFPLPDRMGPLPPSESDSALALRRDDMAYPGSSLDRSKPSREERTKALSECHDHVVRFCKILVPTLLDIYSSTIIYNVRGLVLTSLYKIFSYLETETLEVILKDVQLASFLAGMLSQHDHANLTVVALGLCELLLKKLPNVYRLHFQREGIIAEVEKLASEVTSPTTSARMSGIPPSMEAQHLDTSEDDSDEERDMDSDEEESPFTFTQQVTGSTTQSKDDLIKQCAKDLLKLYNSQGNEEEKEEGATLRKLRSLGEEMEAAKDDDTLISFFKELARYFEGDITSITTYELLESKILDVLLATLANGDTPVNTQRDFLRAFAERHKLCAESSTPLEILVMKLEELLSRSERFEVISVSQGPYDDNRRNPAGMLAKQIRLKVVAEDKNSVPKECQQFTVSIHAITQMNHLASFIRNKIVSHSARPASIAGGGLQPTDILRNLNERSGAFEIAQLAQEMGLPVPPTLARRMAALTSSAPTNDNKSRSSSSRKSGSKGRKGRPGGSRASMGSAVDGRATASDPEMDDLDDDDEELVDEMDDMDEEETENAVSVEVHTPTGTPKGRLSDSFAARFSSAAMSYAAALQQVPQDWHLEFEFAGHTVPLESTVFEPLHRWSGLQTPVNGYYHIFSGMHTIKFRKVPGPPPAQGTDASWTKANLDSLNTTIDDAFLSESTVLSGSDTTTSILKLLKLLHSLSVRWDEILGDSANSFRKPDLASQFVNTKLTAKLNRQLEEPLLIASNCLPTWSQDLARHYPFLFPFETRYLFVQSTSFGYSRCMNRWVPQRTNGRADRRDLQLGRLQRSKLRLQSRENFLRLALVAMYQYAHKPPVLEMEYEDEVGTGLGPTLEFYANTSKEFAKRKLNMWRENDAMYGDEFLHVQNGLFPAPLASGSSTHNERIEYLFGGLGKFVARSMLDSRIIDIHFNPLFFRLAEKEDDDRPSILSLKAVDKRLCDSLRLLQRFADARKEIMARKTWSKKEKLEKIKGIRIDDTTVEDLTLDFTLPGYEIELLPGGKNIDVTIHNVGEYVDLVVDYTIGKGIKRQLTAFKNGFSSVFPYEALCAFTADELVMLFGKSEEDWAYETLLDCVKADHGYNIDSKSVRNLLELLSSLSVQDRRTFLQFLTGSPKLPIGGFKKLLPPFTVVCKPNEPPLTADDYLPSVMTCANYLKLPDYTTKEIMRQKIFTAMTEGSQSFHLS